ncbi:hypothetical protein Tsubulata_010549 [Turnera subulata]|uniref:DUF1997 family protein n=1 Tax=Turnera subulata TaxID=218843 RepID=A0A9Q0FRR6_9ROSI|nr:hypothetical protein Tsubulata_010549 [Turnera subulata]
MVQIAASFFVPCSQQVLAGHYSIEGWKQKQKKQEWQCLAMAGSRSKRIVVKNQVAAKPATYTSRMTTDVPFYESPGASFDKYLEHKSRVFEAIFPDRMRSQKLNEEEWRIQMLPINFLFLNVCPVVDMRLRCKTGGRDYPPGVPNEITKILELDITRWELHGLDNTFDPSQFSLEVKGTLFADRRVQTRLKGQLEMSISLVLPPVVALVPEDVRKSVAESVLTKLVENMKQKVNVSLLTDYRKFRRERL